jgi:hypothetical protein
MFFILESRFFRFSAENQTKGEGIIRIARGGGAVPLFRAARLIGDHSFD